MFLSSYGKNGALEPFEDEAHHHSGRPWLVDESNGFIHPTWFAGFLPTTYDTNPNKTPFSFWENPSKLPYPFHQVWSDPPLTPKVMEKIGVPMGPTVPLSTYLPTETYMHHFFTVSNMIPGIPPNGAPYPQATGHCPTSRFHVDVSWHKSQALVSQLLAKTVALFWVSIGWILPPPECQEYDGVFLIRNPQKMLKKCRGYKTEWGSTPIHWWHVAK